MFFSIYLLLFAVPGLQAEEESLTCVVPGPPGNGYYVSVKPDLPPGSRCASISLKVTCNPGYKLMGEETLLCYEGEWINNYTSPVCKRACKLEPSVGVEYHCLISNPRNYKKTRECEKMELEGTVIIPKCVYPSYYSERQLSPMHCVDGSWNSTPVCLSECGILTPQITPLMVGGEPIKRGEAPWHAGIYLKSNSSYNQICGGTIISKSVVLSAAHCFWSEDKHKLPAIYYAVAVGKLYREWDNIHDRPFAQTSDVKSIELPSRFFGAELNYQNDLAIVTVQTPFEYHPYIRPVCIDFRKNFNKDQLKANNLGKVAGWGLTTGFFGSESPFLKGMDVPFITYDECILKIPATFREAIVGDKFCAGYANGSGLCKGDSGGGLTFPTQDNGVERHYIRGIVSVSPPSLDGEKLCNLKSPTSFTEVIQHASLIGKYLEKFDCANRDSIPAFMSCDGAVDCLDGSDETIATCSEKTCPSFLFRCAYGACADQGSTCNGINECADGSDEDVELCNKIAPERLRISDKKCQEYRQKIFDNSSQTSLNPVKCNYDNNNVVEIVPQDEFSHVVAIYAMRIPNNQEESDLEDNSDTSNMIYGSLISDRYVLTIYDKKTLSGNHTILKVGLGDSNLPVDSENRLEKVVKAVHINPEYDPVSNNAVLALLELESSVPLSMKFRPACLWKKKLFDGYFKAFATGFYVSQWSGTYGSEFAKVSLSLVKYKECQNMTQTSISDIPLQVCVEKPLHSSDVTCPLTGGIPLQVITTSKDCLFHVIGVMSYNEYDGCKLEDNLFFIRVSKYIDWIESVVWPGES